MLFTFWEITQILITIVAVGFIFSGIIKRPQVVDDLLSIDVKPWWHDLKYAAMIAAPAVLLHEFAHKFLALGYGFEAVYNASFWGLGIGIFLKMLAPGFLFFIPGYVAISGIGTSLQFALVALAGPLTNLILFATFWLLLKYERLTRHSHIWQLGKTINLWLFGFNMLPIPGIDGFKFYTQIWQAITG